MRRLAEILIITCFSFTSMAQNGDTLNRLRINDVLSSVYNYHPIIKRAETFDDAAKQRILSARGAFDPTFMYRLNEKNFDEKLYFNNLNSQLQIPLWVGNIQTGVERTRGQFTNPEKETPFDGLYFVGLSVPLGQNLLFDERRKILRQAQLLENLAEAERIELVNQVLVNISRVYWEWFKSYQLYINFLEARDLAEVRLVAIKQLVELGNLAPIDSVEASINLLQREIQLDQSLLDFKNNRYFLSANLWDENGQMVNIPQNFIPESSTYLPEQISINKINEMRDFALNNHPDILKLLINKENLEFEKRFRQELLKPIVNLEYNPLTSTPNPLGNLAFDNRNYTFGLSASMPLFLRNARGNYKFTKTLINQVEFEIQQTRANVSARFEAALNNFTTLVTLTNAQRRQVNDLSTLLNAEQEKFMNGESSVFLINARETNLVNARARLAEFITNEAITYAILMQSAGMVGWNY